MPYFYADPFDYYVYGGVVHAEGLWDTVRGVSFYGTAYGRFGGHGVSLGSSTSGIARQVPGLATVYMGFGATGSFSAGDSTSIRLATLTDGSGTEMIEFRLVATGRVEAWRRSPSSTSGAALLDSADGAFRFGGYNQHLEIVGSFNDVSGVAQLRIDGALVLDFTGDTRFGSGSGAANTTVIGHGITSGSGPPSFHMQDYWTTDTGLLGDKRVRSRPVNAEGDALDWAPSTGTNRATLASDGDNATYNESSTVGHRLGLHHENSDVDTITVSHVLVASRITNAAGGGTKFKHGVRQGATTVLSATEHVTPGAQAWSLTGFDADPTDATSWTPAKVDSMQSVIEKTL